MTKITKGYFDGPYGQVHYREAGDGVPIFLAHQGLCCSRMFLSAFAPLVERGLRPIALDAPGCGMSDAPPTPISIAQYADIYRIAFDVFDLNTAHMLGHHSGASIVCAFAARFPALVNSLILNGPPLFEPADLEPFKDLPHGPREIKEDGSHLMEAWNSRILFTPGWSNLRAMHDRLIDQFWSGDSYWFIHDAVFNHDMKPDFLALSNRTLILSNSGDDIHRLALRGKQLRPDFDFVELSGGTHDIVDEQPEAWADAVVEFVKT